MSVLKSKRKPSQFEVFHHLNKVRKEVTDLLLRDFGYSKRKAAQRLEKKFSGRSYEELTDVEKEIYDHVFNSLEHEKVDKSLLTGKKFLRKHLNIGDQVAQDAGIAYPIPINNYIKIVKGVKFYGRYMDDSYVIHKDKEFLKGLLTEIVEIAHDLGITVNIRKTRICKLSEMWRFLQIQYSLTDTGRVIHKIHPKRLTGMRRKAKKLVLILSEKDFDDWFRSWFNGHCHYMSKLQRSNMLDLCKKLKEEHYYGKTDFS